MCEYRISIFDVLELFDDPWLQSPVHLIPTTVLEFLLLVLNYILFERVNDEVYGIARTLGK